MQTAWLTVWFWGRGQVQCAIPDIHSVIDRAVASSASAQKESADTPATQVGTAATAFTSAPVTSTAWADIVFLIMTGES